MADVEAADAVFLCNAVRGILAVARLGARAWTAHPASVAARRLLAQTHPGFATDTESHVSPAKRKRSFGMLFVLTALVAGALGSWGLSHRYLGFADTPLAGLQPGRRWWSNPVIRCRWCCASCVRPV